MWFETDYDAHRVTAHITAAAGNDSPALSLSVYADSQPILHRTASFHNSSRTALSFTIPEEHFHSWSPESPFLYPVTITLGKDTVQSYFAMRIFTIEHRPLQTDPQKQAPYVKLQIPGFAKRLYVNAKDKADPKASLVPVFCLNHNPCFLMGALDQGYWPDGLYTAPSDEALIYDITVMKSLGYNMLRKHIKVENARWYYHCDRLGMIVCQDMVNGEAATTCPSSVTFPPSFLPLLPT